MCQTTSISEKGMSTIAGILLSAYQLRKQLDLGDPDPAGIAEALAVSRSQMYAMSEPVWSMIDDARGPGRPPATSEATPDSSLHQQLALSMAFGQWLVEHPGAVYKGEERMHCSDGFRAFMVDLFSPDGIAYGLKRDKASATVGMSPHTLTHWLSARVPAAESATSVIRAEETMVHEPDQQTAGSVEPTSPEPAQKRGNSEKQNDEISVPASRWAATAVQVIDLWGRWKGNFTAFCRSLPDHGIHYSYNLVRTILALDGQRPFKRRRGRHPDAEAIRGELERMFANAQWNADGKNVLMQYGKNVYRFNWELVTDNATTGHLGFSVRDHEDSTGVLEAMAQAEATAGEPPVAFLRDPRKSNTADTIEKKLKEKDVVSMFSGVGRPQSNSPAENAFSLFQQKMPPIYIPEGLSEKEMAQRILWYVLFAYSAGRNQTPRRRLKRKTPAQAFADTAVSEEEQAQARERFLELKRQIEEQEAVNRRRCAPAVRQLLVKHFEEHDLEDPRNRYVPQIGGYGPEAALEAIAVFLAKKEAGTLPERNHERYMLGIARNVAYRREDERTYQYYVDLRAKAGDLILRPLIRHDEQLRSDLASQTYRTTLLDLALNSITKIDRVFWRSRFLETFAALTQSERDEQGRWCARRIACRIKLPHRERDHFVALLAEAAMPLAA